MLQQHWQQVKPFLLIEPPMQIFLPQLRQQRYAPIRQVLQPWARYKQSACNGEGHLGRTEALLLDLEAYSAEIAMAL